MFQTLFFSQLVCLKLHNIQKRKEEKHLAMNILMNLDEMELASLKAKFEEHPDKKLPRFNVSLYTYSYFSAYC